MGLAVLVVAVLALRTPKNPTTAAATRTVVNTVTPSRTASPSTSSSPVSSPQSIAISSTAPAAVVKMPLIVLNDTYTNGLAQQAAARFGAGGWTVTDYGNLPSDITDIISTCAYYDPSVSGAQAAAQALQRQYPTIQRVEPRFTGLPAGPVVVVLTSGYSSS